MRTLFPDAIAPTGVTPDAPLHTVFFGLTPPVGVARRAHDLAQGLRQAGQADGALRPERVLHVSLIAAGKARVEPPPARLIQGLRDCAFTVKQRPFAIALNRVESWGRSGAGGPVVALGDEGIVGVDALHHHLAQALGVAERPDFNPHMTLLYGSGPRTPLPIPPITWTVRDFVLIHSLVGLTRYEVLGRFPLSA